MFRPQTGLRPHEVGRAYKHLIPTGLRSHAFENEPSLTVGLLLR
jgi:hypothetical protein